MSDNIYPVKSEPKYRKKLNQEQLAVLNLLYTFKFASSEQVARYSGKKNSKHVQKRLKILEDQELIAKRYDKSYKLKGKSAAYYLTPKGARALIQYDPPEDDEPVNIKRIYKDKDVSENFIQHSINILSIYLQLDDLYDDKLRFFTKTLLSYEKYEYFPQPLPDAFISVRGGVQGKGKARRFFLSVFEDNEPFFVLIRGIKKYLEYAGSGEWAATEIDLPTILMVVEDKSVHKQLRKRIAKELRDSYKEVAFATTRLDYLLDAEYKGKVWFPIDEDGDDPEEPVTSITLTRLPRTDD